MTPVLYCRAEPVEGLCKKFQKKDPSFSRKSILIVKARKFPENRGIKFKNAQWLCHCVFFNAVFARNSIKSGRTYLQKKILIFTDFEKSAKNLPDFWKNGKSVKSI
jgi:hypothetical protein